MDKVIMDRLNREAEKLVRENPAEFPVITGYKQTRVVNKQHLRPLYVNASEDFPMGVWIQAKEGPKAKDGLHVKSRLGDLAYRPGLHLGTIPLATHIGKRMSDGTLAQSPDTVWVECEIEATTNYQELANSYGMRNGKLVPKYAQLPFIPVHGFYFYKTNPNMTGSWILAGNMRITRILTNEEVAEICRKYGYEPQALAV